MVNHRPLNANQRLFVKEYLSKLPLNATDAYQKIYKCSRDTADANGPKLLGDARIKALIDESKANMERKLDIDGAWVVQQLKETVLDCHINGDRSNKIRGLELIGKHFNIFTDKTEHVFPHLDEITKLLTEEMEHK